MADEVRKAPSKPCPKCGKTIHARSKSHEECGWKDTSPSGKTAPSAGKGMSKMEGVRQTLGTLGNDAKPLEIKAYLKKNFNITMDATGISSYKTAILSKARKNGRRKVGRPVAIAVGRPSAVHSISIEDIRAVKELADRIGVERLRQLAEVLAK